MRFGIGECLVVREIDRFAFQGFEEALGLRIVIGIARRRHTHQGSSVRQAGDRGAAGILHAPIRVVHPAGGRLPQGQGLVQRRERELGIDMARQLPAHPAPRPGIEHTSQIHEGRRQADGGDVGAPGLVGSRQHQVGQPVRVGRQAMPRVRRGHPSSPELTEQRFLAHDRQHPLGID